MTRPKGLPKSGGRKKGTPNKSTVKLSEIMLSSQFCMVKELIDLLPSLSKEKQADTLLKLMEFVYPKRKTTEESHRYVDEDQEEFSGVIILPDNGRSASS
jgi:hypothetical protein